MAYAFPTRMLKKTRVFKGAQLRFQIDNLCHWASNGHGIDPESFNANTGTRSNLNSDPRSGQQTPTYIIGLNFNL